MTAREGGGKDSKMRQDSGMHLSNQRTVLDYSFVFLPPSTKIMFAIYL